MALYEVIFMCHLCLHKSFHWYYIKEHIIANHPQVVYWTEWLDVEKLCLECGFLSDDELQWRTHFEQHV